MAAITSFSTVLANYLDYPGTPTKEPASIVFGTPAVLLELPDDVSFWVGTQGTPLPVRISDPAAPTAISLVDWGKPVTVTLPAAADVVDSRSSARRPEPGVGVSLLSWAVDTGDIGACARVVLRSREVRVGKSADVRVSRSHASYCSASHPHWRRKRWWTSGLVMVQTMSAAAWTLIRSLRSPLSAIQETTWAMA